MEMGSRYTENTVMAFRMEALMEMGSRYTENTVMAFRMEALMEMGSIYLFYLFKNFTRTLYIQ